MILDTAFKQQRLKAWQPILTPKVVLPTLFIIGVIFAPIGGLLIWGSSNVFYTPEQYVTKYKLIGHFHVGQSSHASVYWL
jgi:hypothetical protein